MKAINWRPKHGVVLVLLLAIGVVVFVEQSCYGRQVFPRPTVKETFKGQMSAVNDMSITIQRVEALHKSLKSKLVFKTRAAELEYDNLLKNIQKLNGDLKNIKEDIERLNNKKAELLEDVNDLEEKETKLGERITGLSTQVSELEETRKTLETENGLLKENVGKLEGEKVTLKADVDSLEKAKATIKAWFGGGMFSSIIGIILLVLKITSQKKDIKLKQIQIDKIAKKEV